MIKLVKYCKEKHNLKLGCSTIQLASLNYYKNLEDDNSGVPDRTEGLETTKVGFYDQKNAPSHLKNPFPMIRGEGYILNDCIVETDYPNCLIFCLSLDPEKNYLENAKEVHNSYDSYYLIEDINLFVQKLGDLMMESFELSWFHESFQEKMKTFTINDYKRISLDCKHRFVKYVSSKERVMTENAITSEANETDPIIRHTFIKENKYSGQKEYRILFRFIHPSHQVIPVREKPILFNISPILRSIN